MQLAKGCWWKGCSKDLSVFIKFTKPLIHIINYLVTVPAVEIKKRFYCQENIKG